MNANSNELNNLRYAVLIDADNAPRDCLKSVLEEIAIYGTPTIKRIYGDWTNPNVSGWKGSLLQNAVTPIQQYGYTTGKNSTDSAMIIDAMDILYSGQTEGFVIVSSDSDFTRLCIRLREAGMHVIGMGETKTPKPFIAACDKFIYIEVIRDKYNKACKIETQKLNQKNQSTQQNKPVNKQQQKNKDRQVEKGKHVPDEIVELIADSIADLADDDGFTALSNLGNLMIKKQPDFDSRNFGFGKLSTMLKALTRFEIESRGNADTNIKPMFVRDKEA